MEKKRKYKKYKKLTSYHKKLIHKMHDEKMELKKIARVMEITLGAVQYHIKKNARI